MPCLNLEVDYDLGEEEDPGRGTCKEGNESTRDGTLADTVYGFGKGI